MTQLGERVGTGRRLCDDRGVAEAMGGIEDPVGIVVSTMPVGAVDATRMITLRKQGHPDIVTLV